ncbi:cytochrome c [uncultured Psychroserpens sp.]|uniref:c-type cytochrome n=1 Tax=uncultured Psychroserpens sp. TaxID=255436 RepID=UPI0026276EF2|nr:cytochrome c [uncultured Psychroserpens sp.]
MKRLIYISSFIILSGLGLLFLVFNKPQKLLGCGVKNDTFFCGTQAFHNESSSEGKTIFNTNCAACHKLDKKMTGPSLRGVSETYDSLSLYNYIRGNKHEIQSKGYNQTCISFPQLTDKDISDLLSYTN